MARLRQLRQSWLKSCWLKSCWCKTCWLKSCWLKLCCDLDMLAQEMLAQVMFAQVMLAQDMLWPALSGLDQLVLICFPNQPAQRPFVATTSFQEAPWDHVAFKRLSSRSDDDTVRVWWRTGGKESHGPRGRALSDLCRESQLHCQMILCGCAP